MTTLRTGMMAVGVAALLGVALDADAAGVRVQCETRAARSKASVDGNDLAPGAYTARITSGANVATSQPETAIGDEAEFDFDSKPKNVAAGATRIAKNFIQSNSVKGELLDASGAVVAASTVRCRAR